jgi:polyisoprenoid-binding protein YceI
MIRSLALAALAAVPAFAADYAVDDIHSFALFRVQHMGAGFTWGRFETVAGTVSYDPDKVAANKVAITIDAASISAGFAKLDEHLKSPDFFDVKQFPTLTFTSKSFAKTGDGQYDVSGDLTIHGVTKPITVKAVRTGMSKHMMSGKPLVGFETVFEINRSEFGIKYGPGAVGESVRVTLAIEAEAK